MRRLVIALFLCLPATGGMAAAIMEVHWEGLLRVPGRELPLVVDLAPNSAGTWTGSIIIPGLGVNGAPLDKIAVADANMTFVIVNALATEAYGPAELRGQLNTDGAMAGEMRQAGNVANFALKRSGAAQVQLPQRSSAVARDVENQWIGEFELGGYPRHVTIAIANYDNAGATATFVVVGKQTTNLPVDLVLQEGDLLRIESQANQVVFLGVAVAGLLVGSSAHAQAMFRGDAAHAGATRNDARREFHRVKWKFQTGDRIVASPVYQDGAIYFGGDDGYVYAVNATDGRLRWRRKTGGPVPSTPAVAGDTLYIASYDGKFYALDKRTGAPRWKFATGGEQRFEAKGLHGMQPANQTFADPYDVYLSSPVVVAGVVYFGSGDHHVYALDAASGELKWKFKTGDVVHSSPAYADGIVYFGSWDSYFYAVDAGTGKERWRFHAGEDPMVHNQVGFQSSPAVVNGVVYTGCRDSNVYALDAATGKEKWRFNNAGSWVVSSPAVVAGKVIFGTSDSGMYIVLDAETGKPLVQEKGKAYMFSSPLVAGDVVLAGILNGTLEARDLNTGTLLWYFQTDVSKRNAGWVLAADRTFNTPMYFSSSWREAPIVAADRQFGIAGVFATPLVVDGVVYFGSADGILYALE